MQILIAKIMRDSSPNTYPTVNVRRGKLGLLRAFFSPWWTESKHMNLI